MRAALLLLWGGVLAACHKAPAAAVAADPSPERVPLRLRRGEPLRLADGTAVTFDSYIVEEIAAPDGGYGGSAVLVTILAGEQELVLYDGPPEHGEPIGWIEGRRFTLGDHHADEVQLYIDQRTDAIVPGSTTTLRVQRRETVPLGDDITLTFNGHSHKSVMSGGPSSPLMVTVTYTRQVAVTPDQTTARQLDQATYYLEPPEQQTWQWRDHQLRLIDHGYDAWMVLEVSRLELAPVQP